MAHKRPQLLDEDILAAVLKTAICAALLTASVLDLRNALKG